MKFISIIIISAIFCSCSEINKKSTDKEFKLTKTQEVTQNETNKIIIARDVNIEDNFWGPSNFDRFYEITDTVTIREFEDFLKKTYKQGYCCCPDRGYNIMFYDNTNNYKTYFIDTVESKEDLLIYSYSYQFSHKITKSEWHHFLSTAKKITSNEYFICKLNVARRLHQYTDKNNLLIINSRRSSEKWIKYDGHFKFTVSRVGEKLTEQEIISNIKKTYPNDQYDIEITNSTQMCGSSNDNTCLWEHTVNISCNKSFYDKFQLYQPKSFYKTFCPEILVLGSEKSLQGLDSIVEKEMPKSIE